MFDWPCLCNDGWEEHPPVCCIPVLECPRPCRRLAVCLVLCGPALKVTLPATIAPSEQMFTLISMCGKPCLMPSATVRRTDSLPSMLSQARALMSVPTPEEHVLPEAEAESAKVDLYIQCLSEYIKKRYQVPPPRPTTASSLTTVPY